MGEGGGEGGEIGERDWGVVVGGAVLSLSNLVLGCGGGWGGDRNFRVVRETEVFFFFFFFLICSCD